MAEMKAEKEAKAKADAEARAAKAAEEAIVAERKKVQLESAMETQEAELGAQAERKFAPPARTLAVSDVSALVEAALISGKEPLVPGQSARDLPVSDIADLVALITNPKHGSVHMSRVLSGFSWCVPVVALHFDKVLDAVTNPKATHAKEALHGLLDSWGPLSVA